MMSEDLQPTNQSVKAHQGGEADAIGGRGEAAETGLAIQRESARAENRVSKSAFYCTLKEHCITAVWEAAPLQGRSVTFPGVQHQQGA